MVTVSHCRRGTGDPIVLVHGLGSRWQCFDPILEPLAAEHEVIAIDLPGFGGSDVDPAVRPGPHGYADWLARWLADNDVARPHLVGSSMGGGVGLELGRRGVASSVTAFSPVGFWGPLGLRWCQGVLTGLRLASRVGGQAWGPLLGHPASRAVLLSVMFGRPTQVPADHARADLSGLAHAPSFGAARDDFAHYRLGVLDDPGQLGAIPVTVAWGTRDVVLTHRTQSARARKVLPSARHVELSGCGHLPFNDDPARCARVVLDTVAAAEEAR